jgi:hypothetical protein
LPRNADTENGYGWVKITAGLSLGLWLGVLRLGRLLPSFEGSTGFF